MPKLSTRALLSGAVTFTAIFLVISFSAPLLILFAGEELLQSQGYAYFLVIFGFLLYVIPGLIVGYLAQRSAVPHGLAVGAVSAPIMAITNFTTGGPESFQTSSFIYAMVIGLFWCSGASIVGQFIASRNGKS